MTQANTADAYKGAGAYRYFTFCGDQIAHRLNDQDDPNGDYYNMLISEYQCIGNSDVGDKCSHTDRNGDQFPGRCVLM